MGVTVTTDEFGENLDLCSLREMIQAVNINADYGGCRKGTGNVSIPAGTYALSHAGAGQDNNVTGNLDIKATITLVGAGMTASIVNAGQIDRVFQVHSGTTAMTDLKITGGAVTGTSQGGGLLNASTLTLTRVTVSGKPPANAGGGAANTGTLTVASSTIQSNTSGGSGGGIHNTGSLTLNNSSLVDSNTSTNSSEGGGGINSTGTLVVSGNSTIQKNESRSNGGGIRVGGAPRRLPTPPWRATRLM